MTEIVGPRVFISYRRMGGAQAAAQLRLALESKGFSIWQDLVALEGGRDWWSQIEAALKSKSLQHFILIVTEAALTSSQVKREVRLARQEGKTLLPIKGPDLGELKKVPRWLGQVYDLDLAEHRETMERILWLPSSVKRVPMMAPEPPVEFVPRPREFAALKRCLLDAGGDAVAITAALRGAGGYGKTTLAKKLAHDDDIQDAYFDGILWVELGEHGGHRVITLINDIATLLTGHSPQTTTLEGARTALAQALGDLRILLVIDDVWKRPHLDPFLHGGRHTTRLVTTRFDRELPEEAVREKVDAMQAHEAVALLARGLPKNEVVTGDASLGRLAARLHEWPQLLKLANGFLRDRTVKYRQSLADAVTEASKRLTAKGLPAFDHTKAKDYEARHKSVSAAIGLNLDLIDTDKRARFAELGVFPEDADVPVDIVAWLWRETGGLDEFATSDLLTELFDLSLLLDLDLSRRTLRFHDTTRQYLQDEALRSGVLAAQHQRLVAALGDSANWQGPNAEYVYRHLPEHLNAAGDREALNDKLLDPGWLTAKLAATHSPLALVTDYERYGEGQLQSLIGRALRLTTAICARDEQQLLPQLVGRLMTITEAGASAFVGRARSLIRPPAWVPMRASLTPPGAELTRLEGHTGGVKSLVLLPDGRLASGSHDTTVRLWDLVHGAETSRLEGHTSDVTALAMLPDGRLASGSSDNTVRLWDLSTGTEAGRLDGHSKGITSLALLPDGRLASGSHDHTIRLWNLISGAESARLEGHTNGVTALAPLPDGRLASSSYDNTVRLWDIARGAKSICLEGHTKGVPSLALLPDGRLASGAWDNTVRLWDLTSGVETDRLKDTGLVTALVPLSHGRLASSSDDNTVRLWDLSRSAEIVRLEGHTEWVTALAVLPDGRLASCSDDNTVRLWDVAPGVETARLDGHTGWIRALTLLPGQLISGSYDRTIRLWDLNSGAETARLEGHTGWVMAVVPLPDGRLASGSADGTVRLWDATSGAQTAPLKGHLGAVRALAVLPDGRLASGSGDKTVRLWDLVAGAEIACLHGHSSEVRALVLLPDGRLASGSGDATIRLWDLASREETGRLEGHVSEVTALALLPDGRLASGSGDATIRLWDTINGAETARFEGHTGWIMALVALADGRLVSGSWDNTIRLWDPATRTETTRLEIDAPITSLTAPAEDQIVAGDQTGRLHWLALYT